MFEIFHKTSSVLREKPQLEVPHSGTTSTIGAIFIVISACLGAGLLYFPAASSNLVKLPTR